MKFIISESEKNRILNMHKEATKKQYLFEQENEEPKYNDGDLVYTEDKGGKGSIFKFSKTLFDKGVSGGLGSLTPIQVESILGDLGVLGLGCQGYTCGDESTRRLRPQNMKSEITKIINNTVSTKPNRDGWIEFVGKVINPYHKNSVGCIKNLVTEELLNKNKNDVKCRIFCTKELKNHSDGTLSVRCYPPCEERIDKKKIGPDGEEMK
jgi:hypothetical protein